MKLNILFPLLFATLATVPSFSQNEKDETQKPLTEVEKFNERSGSLIKKEFVPVGKIKGCEIQLFKLTDIITKEEAKAVRFEAVVSTSVSSDTKIAHLDPDEIDGLLQTLKSIKQSVITSKESNYVEYIFRSKSGFQAGAFNQGRKEDWSVFLKLEKYGRSSVYLTPSDLDTLIAMVEKAKGML